MRTGDTIVAVASARGRGVRAIVRMSGPGTRDALSAIAPGTEFAPGARTIRVTLGGATLPALAALYEAPRSYTGEDSAELLVAGNPCVVERLVAALCAVGGVRLAEAGEFTARAYLRGRLTLAEAEGVAALIAAEGESERRAADLLVRGRSGDEMRAWADELATLLALVEAGIDFTDQEGVVPIAPEDLRARISALAGAMRARSGEGTPRERAGERPRVALVGPPNAGKSTLFNALLGRRRSVVRDAPGTTRDAVVERCDLSRFAPLAPGDGRAEVDLVDLAGLDAALASRSAVDALAQRGAAAEIERADVVVLCDPGGRFERARWASSLPAMRSAVRVRTKADLPAGDAPGALAVCAIDGFGIGPLARAIADAAFGGATSAGDLIPRHALAVRAAVEHLDRAGEAARAGLDQPELVADALWAALDALGKVVGQVSPDDVLGRIFSSFCVGK